MILCINCSPEVKAKMDSLLNRHNYSDYSELIAIAVENLFVLTGEVESKGALVIGEGLDCAGMPQPVTTAKDDPQIRSLDPQRQKTSGAKLSNVKRKAAPIPTHIPEIFLSDGLDIQAISAAEIPPATSKEEVYTLDKWIFGQYNKLLPAKASCRALVRLVGQRGAAVSLESVTTQISEAAILLGDHLAGLDRISLNNRDDALATAFPRSGPDAEKGRMRYATHFVGSVNSQGVLGGILSDYRFALVCSGEMSLIQPTMAAVAFSHMANPILDGCQGSLTQKFNQEELRFLVAHIHAHVPEDDFAFRTLAEAILAGADTPDKLDEALRHLVPPESNRSFSSAFLASQRSGAISRMADLGLVRRVRDGVRVKYTITEQGRCAFVTDQP